MIRVANKYGSSGWIKSEPTKEELERKTVPQLLAICTCKVWRKHPFKQALIEFILKQGELNL